MRRAATAANAVLSATVLVAMIASPLARADPAAPTTPVVTTTAGKVQGEVVDGIYTFKGIPYAADTSGANRWTAPKDPEAWSDVRNATTFMDWCPQAGSDDTPMSEDCLGLNVYTPALDEKLPVMVWIHGGALMGGDGSANPPQGIVRAGDVVVVTINYRVSFLGYFAHPELNGTNFGLLDQIKALEWVRENIESFGGDPSNVTIFGQSAGGTSVLALMASPLSEGLFRRGISQSAAWDESPNITVSEGGKLGVAVGEQLGLPAGAGQLEKMRAASAQDLVQADVAMMRETGAKPSIFIDEESFPKCLWCAFAESDQEDSIHKDVALMIGTNNNETSAFWQIDPDGKLLGFKYPNTTETYRALVERIYGPEKADKIFSIMPGSPDAVAQSIALTTAITFGAPANFAADRNSNLGNPTFMYYFTQGLNTTQSMGAGHGADLKILFDDAAQESSLAEAMQTYWTNFAKSGNPNSGGSGSDETLPEWKAYEDASPTWQVLSEAEIVSEPVPEDTLALYSVINTIYQTYPDIMFPLGYGNGKDFFNPSSSS